MPDPTDAFDPSMIDELRELSQPGDDLAVRVVGVFRRDLPLRLADIRESYAQRDGGRLHRTSHTLKGAAGNLGLAGLADACEVVVEATRAWELDPVCDAVAPEHIAAIEAAASRAEGHLDAALGGPGSDSPR